MVREFRIAGQRNAGGADGLSQPDRGHGLRGVRAGRRRGGRRRRADGRSAAGGGGRCGRRIQGARTRSRSFCWRRPATDARIARMAELGGGFVYYVSFKGVTGASQLDVAAVARKLQQIRAVTRTAGGRRLRHSRRRIGRACRRGRRCGGGRQRPGQAHRRTGGCPGPGGGRMRRRSSPHARGHGRARRWQNEHKGNRMSWFEKLMPSRIRTEGGNKRAVPEGLWTKCPGCECGALSRRTGTQSRTSVPSATITCASARAGGWTCFSTPSRARNSRGNLEPSDPLKFKDSKKYRDRLSLAQKATGESEAHDRHARHAEGAAAGGLCVRVRFHGRLHGFGRRRALRARGQRLPGTAAFRWSVSPPAAVRACRKRCIH